MHPLAHVLAGALVGQAAGTPAAGMVGGIVTHYLLDAVPHTEGVTYRGKEVSGLTPDLIEAGVEAVAGIAVLAWMVTRCPQASAVQIGSGVLGGLLPDLVDVPLRWLTGVTILHMRSLHWTVRRRHAVWGILTQVAVIAASAFGLWRLTGCGL